MHTGQSSSKVTQIQEACCVCSFPQIIDKVAFSTVLLTAKIEIRYPYNVFHSIMSVSHVQDVQIHVFPVYIALYFFFPYARNNTDNWFKNIYITRGHLRRWDITV